MCLNDPTRFRTYYREKEEQVPGEKKDISTVSSEVIRFNHSSVNLAWYVTEAVLKKLIIDKKNPKKSMYKCYKVVVGFKLSVLARTIK